MPSAGRDTSAFRVVLAIFGVWLLWQLRDVALLLFGAIIVAALLRAFSDPLSRGSRLPSRPAVLTVALGLLAILVLIVWSLGEPLAHQLQELRTALPKAWASVREWLERFPMPALVEVMKTKIEAATWMVRSFTPGQKDESFTEIDPRIARVIGYHRMQEQKKPGPRLGQAVAMLMVGVTVGIGLALLGMPLAPALGLISGLLEFVPFFGPIASALLAVLVAFAQGPQEALYVAIFFVVIQQLEGNVVIPFVQRWAVHMPPLLSVLAGGRPEHCR